MSRRAIIASLAMMLLLSGAMRVELAIDTVTFSNPKATQPSPKRTAQWLLSWSAWQNAVRRSGRLWNRESLWEHAQEPQHQHGASLCGVDTLKLCFDRHPQR